MKKLVIAAILLLSAATGAFAVSYKEALGQDKPILLFFQMNGCSACRQAKPIYENLEKSFSNKFNFVKDDVNASRLSSQFGVDSVPAMFIVDPKTKKSVKIPYSCILEKSCMEKTLNEYK